MKEPQTNEAATTSGAERRQHERIKQRSLESSLGPVVDLSLGGMCVISPRRLEGTVTAKLPTPDGGELELEARVVWTKRLGIRRHVTGLHFIDVTPSVEEALDRIGTET